MSGSLIERDSRRRGFGLAGITTRWRHKSMWFEWGGGLLVGFCGEEGGGGGSGGGR